MNILIFGGTFDPPHLGHLKIAEALQSYFHFDRFIFMPCKIPVLKNKAAASSEQRIAMLKILLANNSNFKIDTQEITRETPSYTVITLKSLRNQFGKIASISLLLGMDAFLDLPKWHHWQEILKLCNIIIVNRPNFKTSFSDELKIILENKEVFNKQEILDNTFGKIFKYNAGEFDISSSKLRQEISTGIYNHMPTALIDYIKKNKLYQES